MTHNMRRRALLTGALAAAGLASASRAVAFPFGKRKSAASGASSASTQSTAALNIALVLRSVGDPYTIAMADAAKNYQQHFASQFGLTIRGTAKTSDTAVQVQMVDEMIAAKMNAIVIAPTDSKALVAAAARAIKAGIVVIAIDNPLDDSAQDAAHISVPFVGPNNRKGAVLIGNYVAQRLNAGDQVGIVEGNGSDRNAQQRTAGWREAMDAAGLKIVAIQSGNWDYGQGRDVAARMLADHPHLRALLCGNASMAMGAVDAVRDAGRGGAVYVTGYDAPDALKPLLADGRVLATIDQFPARQAVFGIDFALKAVTEHRKQSELSPLIETPLQLVTSAKR